MKTLLWREFHWNRLIIVLGASILVLPYVFVTLLMLFQKGGPKFSTEGFSSAAAFSFALLPLAMVFMGGNAFAGERSDQSAQFLAFLPISRRMRLLSKLVFAAIMALILIAVNFLVAWVMEGELWHADAEGFRLLLNNIFSSGLVTFGVAWLISSFQSSPTFAICGGIIVPFLTIFALSIVVNMFDIPGGADFAFVWYWRISIVSGTIGFALGTYLFLKRVEP